MRRTSCVALILAVVGWMAALAQKPAPETPAPGGERWEVAFRALPAPANIRAYDERLSARPHHVGSPYDKDNAEWMAARFKEWGWDAQIERFDVLFPTPKERLLEMVAPTRFVAKLEEPAVPVDPTSGQKAEQLPTYNAYSTDGDVTAPLVYVNYGRPVDYEQLERLGISVKGAIVIARYGASWRGIKPKVAAEHGAVGCLIYSDPRDDGYFGGDVYPEGPMRARDGVQRGSVADMPVYPGDPLTPGVGATPQAKRLAIKDARTITKIPVLPISYGDAQPLLAALEGPLAPVAWRGALPITYHVGPGRAAVHLKLVFNWDTKPIYDVIARLPGSTYPDEWIVRGNHHDAWVNGAGDPVTGISAELEEARALGELRKQGWQPKRTIVYAAWDGEEPGLLGSTEWVETHGAELEAHAVVYINTDSNGRGYLDAAGSHTLEPFINGVAKSVEDPEARVSAWKRLQAALIANGTPEERQEARTRGDLRIGALGSGSDFTPFLQHSGVPTLSLGYGGEDDSGIYHSIYDDFYHYTHFEDTGFVYGRLAAQTVGTAVIRLADAEILPFDFARLAETAREYVVDVQALLKRRQDEVRERNEEIEDGVFAATNNPRRPLVAPAVETLPPALNFAPLENASARLTAAAERYKKALAGAVPRLAGNVAAVRAINARLIQSERQFLDPGGLPHREWYRHLLYAPGFYTGYDVKTLPGVREGIEQRQYAEAEAEILRAAKALEREAFLVEAAAADLERLAPQSATASPAVDEALLHPDAPEMNTRAPERFVVRLDTSQGPIRIEVTRAWAPRGADRFFNLVRHGYYDQARFFRVIKGQWAQFGISAEPRVSKLWRNQTIPDDPAGQSNVRGTIAFAFAVPNGRTAQVFINLRDNSATHDKEPFVPFGRVIEGMDVADALYSEYGAASGGGIRAGKQDPLFEGGNAYLDREFPHLDFIRKATIEMGERKTCTAPDGVRIVYSVAGSGEPALLFVHGGLANRQFWDGELKAFAASHRVIALDLAGHGESGANRTKWGLPEFGADVRAVVEAERVNKVILFGNSLGGPVAVEAALLMPGKVLGVVGVDTFQRLDYVGTADDVRQRAEAFRRDYAGSLKEMVKALFHADAPPALLADAERRMSGTSPEAAWNMFMGMAGYDLAASVRKLTVPLRAINGDLYATDVQGNRKIKPDFDAVVMKHVGHYPMLEQPDEFDRHVAEVVRALAGTGR